MSDKSYAANQGLPKSLKGPPVYVHGGVRITEVVTVTPVYVGELFSDRFTLERCKFKLFSNNWVEIRSKKNPLERVYVGDGNLRYVKVDEWGLDGNRNV